VINNVNAQFDFGNPPRVATTGVQGNNAAILVGTIDGGFSMIARRGAPAPGTDGLFFNLEPSALNPVLNNNNSFLFDTETTRYMAGETIGVVGETASSIRPAGPRIMYSWSPSYGLVPMIYQGQALEVETGVFKTVSQWNVNALDNGNAGGAGLNDDGVFAARITFTDNSWAVIRMQIPAPGTGMMAMLGLGALARRRRR
jgi:hypothetical protein